jgi:hypothetical protein
MIKINQNRVSNIFSCALQKIRFQNVYTDLDSKDIIIIKYRILMHKHFDLNEPRIDVVNYRVKK